MSNNEVVIYLFFTYLLLLLHRRSTNWGKPIHLESDMEQRPDSSLEGTLVEETIPSKMTESYHEEASPSRMFGDTIQYRQAKPVCFNDVPALFFFFLSYFCFIIQHS